MRLLPRSLFGRLALIQIGFGSIVALLFVLAMELTHDRFHLASSQQQARSWADRIVRDNQKALTVDDEGKRREFLAGLERNNPAARFYLVDAYGTINAAAVPLANLSRKRLNGSAIKDFVEGSSQLPVMLDDPRAADGRRIFSAAKIAEGPTAGYLLMILEPAAPLQFLSAHAGYLLSDSLIIASGVTIPAVAVATLLLFAILRPIRRLSSAITRFERHDPSEEVIREDEPCSEADELGRHFAQMERRIAGFLAARNEENRSRREVFANLSHDFRTPLTVIDGCLETLRDKSDELTVRQKRRILEAAIGQSLTMKRLIASALEFAALNRIDYPLHMETFLLAELIADIGAKFAGRAEQFGRKLIIDVEPSDRNRPCHADPFLIERALDNLIDNAILHARGADRITVAMRRAGTTQEVCVSDNGCGIAEAFVGEPDAETEASSPARRTGRGLGIVKRIAMLHGGSLVVATPTAGGTAITLQIPNRLA